MKRKKDLVRGVGRSSAEGGLNKTLSKPQVFLLRMLLFIVLAVFLALILYKQIATAFMANPGLNGMIVLVLVIGIVYAFRQISQLYPEIRWVNTFRIADPGLAADRPPVLLAPMANLLRERTGQITLNTTATRSILDSIGARLDESRDTTRYLVGLLIFLGLLGTFWGLLETINSVGKTIGSLDTGSSSSLVLFEELKAGLEAPLSGMGTAFSSSLFGLAGSLVLGFLDLQAGQAQSRFYNEFENWLSGLTEIAPSDAAGAQAGSPQIRFALLDMQRTISDLGDKVDMGVLQDNSSPAVEELAKGIEKLVKQMRAEQRVVREWVDEQSQQQSELAEVLRNISKQATGAREE